MEAGPPAHHNEEPTVVKNTNAPLQTTQIASSDQQQVNLSNTSEQSSLANLSLSTDGGGQADKISHLHTIDQSPPPSLHPVVNSSLPMTEQKMSHPESGPISSPSDVPISSNSADQFNSTPSGANTSVRDIGQTQNTPSTISVDHNESGPIPNPMPRSPVPLPSVIPEHNSDTEVSTMEKSVGDQIKHDLIVNRDSPEPIDMGESIDIREPEDPAGQEGKEDPQGPGTSSREVTGDKAAQPSAEQQKAEASNDGHIKDEVEHVTGVSAEYTTMAEAEQPTSTHNKDESGKILSTTVHGLSDIETKASTIENGESSNSLTEAIKRDPGSPEHPIPIKPWEVTAEESPAKPAATSTKRKKRTRASDVGATETPRKKGKSLESNSPGTATALVTVDTKCLPSWWSDPILYFSKEKPYDNSKRTTSRVWVTRPDPRVCVGAAWLKKNCSASTMELDNHPEGPTQILRELTALVQSEADKPSVFDSNYTTFTRANFRMQIDPSRFDTPFVSSIMLKLNTDREVISFVPLDILLGAIVAHAEAFVEHSGLFPNFWVANELTLFQKAPTIAYTLLKVLHHPPINIGEFIAALYPGLPSIDVFREMALSCRGNASTPVRTSRRRAEPITNPSFKLDQNQLQVVKGILAELKRRLNIPISSNLAVKQPQELTASKTWKAGESLTPDGCQCTILTRYGAAIRFSIYEKYGIQPFILAYDTMTPLENIRALLTESTNWLASEPKTYLDFTLAANQTSFIMSLDRLAKEDNDLPIAEDAEPRALITSLLTQNTLRAQSHPTGNLTLKITEPTEWNSKRNEQNVTLHASLIASCEIPKDARLTLAARSPVTWGELARDDEEDNNNDAESGNDTITDDDDNPGGPSE